MCIYRGADKSLVRPGTIQANVSVRMEWISFGALPCRKKKNWWQLRSRCCWNRARPWHASKLVFFLVGLRTYQHPGIEKGNQCRVQIINVNALSFFLWLDSPCCTGVSSLSRPHDHTQTHHSRYDSSGRVISSSQTLLPDNTQHSQDTDMHASGGIRTCNPTVSERPQNHALDRAATVIGFRIYIQWMYQIERFFNIM